MFLCFRRHTPSQDNPDDILITSSGLIFHTLEGFHLNQSGLYAAVITGSKHEYIIDLDSGTSQADVPVFPSGHSRYCNEKFPYGPEQLFPRFSPKIKG